MKWICTVYRSPRREGMYLYVVRDDGLSRVPPPLLERFGKAEEVMTLVVTPERKLARMDGGQLLEAIQAQGYYLQLPSATAADMASVAARNDRLE